MTKIILIAILALSILSLVSIHKQNQRYQNMCSLQVVECVNEQFR